MAQTIDLEDVVLSAMETALQGVWTAMPGRVESYDAATQTARIQVTVKNPRIDENGDRQADTIAILPAAPVVHLCGGPFRTVYPVVRGDTVLVVFTSRPLGQWHSLGGVVDPGVDHHHDLSDGVAFVGLRDSKRKLKNAPTDRMSIGHDEGATIEITQSKVRVGGNTGTQPTHKATSYKSAFDTLINSIATAVAGIPGGGGASGAITTALGVFHSAEAGFTTTIAEVK